MKKLLCQKAKKKVLIKKDVLFQPINRQADRQTYTGKTDNERITKQTDTKKNKQIDTPTN